MSASQGQGEVPLTVSEAEDTLRAIRLGEVDALIIEGPEGTRIFTLRDAEVPYRRLVEAMQEGAATLHSDGTLLYANQSFATLLSVRLERLVGQPFARFVHPDHLAAYQALLAEGGKGAGHHELMLVAEDGREIPVQLSITLLQVDGLECLSAIIMDLTKEKQALADLAASHRRLLAEIEDRKRAEAALHQQQKIETIGQLTGGIAHDFNNLLMAVLGSLELLQKKLPDDPRLHRLVGNAVQGAQRGAALTRRMLAFARQQELKPVAVNVPDLVAGMLDILKQSLGPGIRIKIAFPPSFSAALVDPNQLELALLNLALNARDAMPNGGQITISGHEERVEREQDVAPGNYVCISVTDTGTGMDEATLERATEPFFTTKGPRKGTGLGLAMISGLAAQSGGALRLSSRLGNGTTAQLALRRAEEARHEAPARHKEMPEHEKSRPLNVLLVDDDALISMGTAAMLEDLGHEVVEASSAAQALEILEAASIDLVITDHAMPNMTGAELTRVIQERWPQQRVILASGYAELPEGEVSDVPRLGKPYSQHELAACIATLL